MFTYDTVLDAVNDLKLRGFAIDFNLRFNEVISHDTPVALLPSEFEIVEFYRFEGDSNPDEEAVVYAIESKHGLKGVLVNGYGISAEEVSGDMVQKLAVKH